VTDIASVHPLCGDCLTARCRALKKGSKKALLLPILKLVTKMEHNHQDIYSETFSYMIYRISLSHSYHTQNSAVQVYVSPSLFIPVNENKNRFLNGVMGTETKRELGTEFSSQLHVQ
jgi:hypothetical protein